MQTAHKKTALVTGGSSGIGRCKLLPCTLRGKIVGAIYAK